MNEIIKFNPEQSANKVKKLWYDRQIISLEIVSELYKAKNYYSNRGHKRTISTYSSFKEYLFAVGLYETKVYKWLERYIPEENKLLTWKENEEKKQIEYDRKKTIEQKEKEKRQKELKLDNHQFEKLYLENKLDVIFDDNNKQKRWESYKNLHNYLKEEEKKQKQHREQPKNNIVEEAQEYLKEWEEKEREKNKIKNKIGMSINDNSKFIDALNDYLNTLQTDNLKLNALHNIIKFCKVKVNELQQKSIF